MSVGDADCNKHFVVLVSGLAPIKLKTNENTEWVIQKYINLLGTQKLTIIAVEANFEA